MTGKKSTSSMLWLEGRFCQIIEREREELEDERRLRYSQGKGSMSACVGNGKELPREVRFREKQVRGKGKSSFTHMELDFMHNTT